ncbi:MAG: cupin [Candidatus Levybacteria bacterium]|nr:cupin [Candidatus Levybacteria bacterium]
MNFDPKNFSNSSYIKRVEKPWGYELHFVPEDMPYMGKLIHIDKNKRLSLQVHDKKQETQMLINGKCNLIQENNKGRLITIEMRPFEGYTAMIGQKHRLRAVTDCDVVEVSTPELGTTWRLEDDYKRPDETEQMRKSKNRGWKDS